MSRDDEVKTRRYCYHCLVEVSADAADRQRRRRGLQISEGWGFDDYNFFRRESPICSEGDNHIIDSDYAQVFYDIQTQVYHHRNM